MSIRYWHYPEISTSGQPILREGERDIYIEQNVGLYHGKSKITNKQKGRCYLTSQRVIYIDDNSPFTESVCIELDDVKELQYNSKFLKKSAKLVLFLKDSHAPNNKQESGGNSTSKPRIVNKSTWTCPICMVTNECIGELKDPVAPCVNCGVSADYDMIANSIIPTYSDNKGDHPVHCNECPACTFINHPLLSNCEICGTRLPLFDHSAQEAEYSDTRVSILLEAYHGIREGDIPFVQVSFRKSDGSIISQAVCKALSDLKTHSERHLYNQNLVSVNGINLSPDWAIAPRDKGHQGIARLESSKEHQLLKNDILLNNALSDMNNLMALATEIENIYQVEGGKDDRADSILIIDRDKFLNKSAFLDEVSREIYQLVMSEFKEQMQTQGGLLVTLVDLYALYNKSMRIGTGFISPNEMREACGRFTKLGLNDLNLKRINDRVLCISYGDSFAFIKKKLLETIELNPGADLLQITHHLNNRDSSSWAIGIIMEVLQYCITEGDLLVDEQISGIHYYVNSHWKLTPGESY